MSDLLDEANPTTSIQETKKEALKPKEKPMDNLFQSDYSSSSIKEKKKLEEDKGLKPIADTIKIAPVQPKKKKEIDGGILAVLIIGKK